MSPFTEALLTLLHCLALTVLLELGLAMLLGIRQPLDFVNLFLAQVMTNPLVVVLSSLAYALLPRGGYIAAVAALEISAFLAEGILYRKVLRCRRIPPFLLSLILNAFSFGIGEVLGFLQ